MAWKFLFFSFCMIAMVACREPEISVVKYDSKAYPFSSEIQKVLDSSDELGFSATQFSFISEYEKLLTTLDRNADTIKPISVESWRMILDTFSFVEAKSEILKRADNHNIVMFNEAHYIPYHRSFITSLLKDFKEKGFENLALEGIGMTETDGQYDKNLRNRGYPMLYSGHYLKEPEFSVLIRTAADLGFNILGYDQGSSHGFTGGDREIQGAKNILDHIQKPDGSIEKTLVLCGWDHLREGNSGTYWEYALAARIYEMSGENPLTIQQTTYIERSNKIYEDSIYQRFDIEIPSVLIDAENNTFTREKMKHWYDLIVFHPRTRYDKNIPHWVLKNRKLAEVELDEIDIACPCKFFVFDEEDDTTIAVPTFISEIKEKPRNIFLPFRTKHDKVIVSNKELGYLIQY